MVDLLSDVIPVTTTTIDSEDTDQHNIVPLPKLIQKSITNPLLSQVIIYL